MTPAPLATLPTKSPLDEIARIDRQLDANRAMLVDPGEADLAKVRARIDELLDDRLVWMAKRDASKPKRRAKKAKGVSIPTDPDL